jgi:hypothetical protein
VGGGHQRWAVRGFNAVPPLRQTQQRRLLGIISDIGDFLFGSGGGHCSDCPTMEQFNALNESVIRWAGLQSQMYQAQADWNQGATQTLQTINQHTDTLDKITGNLQQQLTNSNQQFQVSLNAQALINQQVQRQQAANAAAIGTLQTSVTATQTALQVRLWNGCWRRVLGALTPAFPQNALGELTTNLQNLFYAQGNVSVNTQAGLNNLSTSLGAQIQYLAQQVGGCQLQLTQLTQLTQLQLPLRRTARACAPSATFSAWSSTPSSTRAPASSSTSGCRR